MWRSEGMIASLPTYRALTISGKKHKKSKKHTGTLVNRTFTIERNTLKWKGKTIQWDKWMQLKGGGVLFLGNTRSIVLFLEISDKGDSLFRSTFSDLQLQPPMQFTLTYPSGKVHQQSFNELIIELNADTGKMKFNNNLQTIHTIHEPVVIVADRSFIGTQGETSFTGTLSNVQVDSFTLLPSLFTYVVEYVNQHNISCLWLQFVDALTYLDTGTWLPEASPTRSQTKLHMIATKVNVETHNHVVKWDWKFDVETRKMRLGPHELVVDTLQFVPTDTIVVQGHLDKDGRDNVRLPSYSLTKMLSKIKEGQGVKQTKEKEEQKDEEVALSIEQAIQASTLGICVKLVHLGKTTVHSVTFAKRLDIGSVVLRLRNALDDSAFDETLYYIVLQADLRVDAGLRNILATFYGASIERYAQGAQKLESEKAHTMIFNKTYDKVRLAFLPFRCDDLVNFTRVPSWYIKIDTEDIALVHKVDLVDDVNVVFFKTKGDQNQTKLELQECWRSADPDLVRFVRSTSK